MPKDNYPLHPGQTHAEPLYATIPLEEYDCNSEKWNRIREKMKRCKEDCEVQFGVISNGYSLHIKLPFDVDKAMKEAK